MAAGEFREQVEQIGVGFDAIDLAGSDQAGKARPIPAAHVMTGEECIAAVDGRAADCVFEQIRIHIDMAVVQKEAVRCGCS